MMKRLILDISFSRSHIDLATLKDQSTNNRFIYITGDNIFFCLCVRVRKTLIKLTVLHAISGAPAATATCFIM